MNAPWHGYAELDAAVETLWYDFPPRIRNADGSATCLSCHAHWSLGDAHSPVAHASFLKRWAEKHLASRLEGGGDCPDCIKARNILAAAVSPQAPRQEEV